MLDLMLGNTPDAFSCGEVCAWFRPWRTSHFEIRCPCGAIPCPAWKKLSHVPESQFHATVFRELGVKFVIDSSKEECWLIDTQQWAAVNGITVFNLLLWKNPIDLAYSYWKRGESKGLWRSSFVNYHTRILDIGLPFRSVHFNELVSKPEQKLAQICTAIGMPYLKHKERFWDKQHHHMFGSSGTRQQIGKKDSVIRANEAFAPEFEAQLDSISNQIARDSRVQSILGKLRQMEISSHPDLPIENEPFVAPKPYPVWYHVRAAKRLLRRRWPQRYTPDADRRDGTR